MNWPEVHAQLLGPTKQKMKGLEDLQALVQTNFRLSTDELHELVDVTADLLADNNHKICQGTLAVLTFLVDQHADPIKPYTGILVPLVVERLGDAHQAVRLEASGLLLSMMSHLPLGTLMEKMSRGYSHRAWKVKHGVLQTLAEAISTNILDLRSHSNLKDHIITSAVNLLEDKNENVRDAAQDLLQELYRDLSASLIENLQQQSIRPVVFRDLISKLDTISPTGVRIVESPPPGSAGVTAAASDISTAALGASTGPLGRSLTLPATRARPSSAPAGADPAAAAAPALPAPVLVVSDKELLAEMAAMVVPLTGTVADWQLRIGHMDRLQGLALGCPAQWHDTLLEGLRTLRDSLVTQVEDRRSAVSKAACQLLSTLSNVLGLRFQELLSTFLPVLFKVLPITVQVMADAADACCLSLMSSCPSPKALSLLSHAVVKDKNAKIRGMCAGYLAKAVESWDPSTLSRCTEELESAMKSACQDSSSDARAAARRMYAAYCTALPDAAAQFTRATAANLIDRMKATASKAPVAAAKKVGKPFLARASSASFPGRAAAEPEVLIVAPPARTSSPMLPLTQSQSHQQGAAGASGTATAASNGTAAGAPPRPTAAASRVVVSAPQLPLDSAAAMAPPPPPAAVPAAVPRPPPSALGGRRVGVAARVSGPTSLNSSHDATSEALASLNLGHDSSRPMASKARRSSVGHYAPTSNAPPKPLATRMSDSSAHTHIPALHAPHSAAVAASTSAPVSFNGSVAAASAHGMPLRTVASAGAAGALGHAQAAGKAPSLARLTTTLLTGQKQWNEKVDVLTGLSEALRALKRGSDACVGVSDSTQSLPADPTRDMERLVPKLLEILDEPHVKVVVAALSVLSDATSSLPHTLEPSLDRILPCVFARQQDSKDAVRHAAGRVLTEMESHYGADQLMPGLLRTLDSSKQPRVRQAALECGTAILAAPAAAASGTASAASASPAAIKQWLRAVSALVSDKTLDLRRAAAEAVRAVYRADPACVELYVRHSSGAEGLALKRLLTEIVEEEGVPSVITTAHRHAATASHTGPSSTGSHTSEAAVPHSSASNGVRSYPLELSGYDTSNGGAASGATSGGGAAPAGIPSAPVLPQTQQAHAGQTLAGRPTPYVHQDYMSPYKFEGHAAARVSQDADVSLLDDQDAYAMVAPIARAPPPLHVTLSVTAGDRAQAGGGAALIPDAGGWRAIGGAKGASALTAAATAVAAVAPSVPADQAGQMRLLHWLITRLSGPSALDALHQLEQLCTGKVGSTVWLARGPQLITDMTRHVINSPQSDIREAGLRLLSAMALYQPAIFSGPTQGLLETLIPALTTCAASHNTQTSKCVFEAFKDLVPILPHTRTLHILTDELAHLCEAAGPGPACQGVCVAVQRLLAVMAGDALADGLPAALVPLLQTCAQEGPLEVRKAAVYALAQLRITLGDARFAPCAARLNACQQQLVTWAVNKLQEAATNSPKLATGATHAPAPA